MTLSSILGFIALAGWIMVLAGAGIAISNAAQNRPTRGGIALAAIGLLVGVIFFIASSGLVQVGATQVAVIFQAIGGNPANSNLWDVPLGPGTHIIVPIINEPIFYDTSSNTYTMSRTAEEGQVRRADAVEAQTRDRQQVAIDVSVIYSVDPNLANQLHRTWQNRFEDEFVRPAVRSAVRSRIANYSVNDLYGGTGLNQESTPSKLPEVQALLQEELQKSFANNGLRLQSLLLREIAFSEQFIQAVEEKQVAEQQAERAKLEADRARTVAQGQADAAVTAARGESQAAEERAKGEAAAIELRAAAEAKALELINEQLSKNPNLIQWRYVERLSDKVSLILLPQNSPFLFDINQLQTAAGNR